MPAAAIPAWALITSAVAPAAASIASGALQSRAAGKGANAQMQSANYAADRQLEGQRAQEAFLRQQAENTYKQQEADRRANYDQYVARQRRMNSVGQALGYGGGTDIQAYTPMIDPQYTAGPAQPAQSAPPPPPNPAASPYAVASQRTPPGQVPVVRPLGAYF